MILNEYGAPVSSSSKFAHAADKSRYRGPQFDTRVADIDKLIPAHDRKTLVSLSRRLFLNMGVPRAAIRQKAAYSVGAAWLPTYAGTTDQEAGKEVASFMRNVWFPNCDVRGGMFDWHELLELSSEAIDRDGEAFIVFIRTEEDFPFLQQVPSHRVDNFNEREGEIESGPYNGRVRKDGIIYSRGGRPVAYQIATGTDAGVFRYVPAEDVIHLYDPSFQEQGRGLPAFTHALEDLKHCLQSTEYERIRQMILSSIGLIEHNETGGPDLDDPAFANSQLPSGSGLTAESFAAGAVRYFRAGSGSKLEQLKHESPGEIWESFHDRMIRSALVGIDWSYSLVWKPAGQGTAERAEQQRARRSVITRQKILRYLAKRAFTWAYSVFAMVGRIPLLKAPFSWTFTTPPRLSVDDGREDKALIEGWRAGAINATEIFESRGTTAEEFYRQRANDIVLRKTLAREMSVNGIVIEDREMAMLTPNEVSTTAIQTQNEEEKEDHEDDVSD